MGKKSNFLAKTKWKLKIRTKFNFANSFLQVLNNCSHPSFVVLLGQHDWNRDNFSFMYVSSQNAIKAKINLKEFKWKYANLAHFKYNNYYY